MRERKRSRGQAVEKCLALYFGGEGYFGNRIRGYITRKWYCKNRKMMILLK